ncbi:hypothetical protein DP939_00915 [Spongiactinospora rosea]|uniref:Uncharacterized protein n=1 Tax=Spongiactinospora rosea TaxID=2248750 RepID=A0A366M5J6_9ACTN|nr:hypothetical protein [Spongiactinospora rosea]RBQ21317.1 hypothetical protein DP939_00915 [Spongiactinospora rosea]
MRSKLPAVRLLLLSWLVLVPWAVPTSAAASAAPGWPAVAEQVAAQQARQQPGLGREPYHHGVAQARHLLLGPAGFTGPAVLPAGLAAPRPAWAVITVRAAVRTPDGRRVTTTPARGPPSTRC